MEPGAPRGLFRRAQMPLWVLIVGATTLATVVILSIGWISDDAFITARYAQNLLHGHGAVFNPGERVQGYTHPLWFGLFAAALAILQEPLLVAVTLGALFTVATFGVVGTAFLRMNVQPRAAMLAFAIFAVALLFSESWRSFQTGGLENALTHFLLAILIVEVVTQPELRLGRLSLYAALMVLTRPDFAVFVAPISLLVLVTAWHRKQLPPVLLGFSPVVLWLVFAQLYYGSILPNTAITKLGVYSLSEGIGRGLVYVLDWAAYEPSSAFFAIALSVVAFLVAKRSAEFCLLLGVVLYMLGVIVAGGDFMRGRMILPAFFAIVLFASLGLPSLIEDGQLLRSKAWGAVAVCLVMLVALLAPAQSGSVLATGITNERIHYSGQTLTFYVRFGELVYGARPVEMVADLQAFNEQCGSFSIHMDAIGAFAYQLGSEVFVIDSIGLTDAYVARLPNSYLVDDNPRPGHPVRRIPVSYLAGRGDIGLFDNWRDAVRSRDCGIIEASRERANSTEVYTPREEYAVYE